MLDLVLMNADVVACLFKIRSLTLSFLPKFLARAAVMRTIASSPASSVAPFALAAVTFWRWLYVVAFRLVLSFFERCVVF